MTKYPIQGRRNRMGIGCDWGDGGVFGIALPSDKETTLPVESGKEPFDRSKPPAASREAMRRTALPALPVHSPSRHDRFPDLHGDPSGDQFEELSLPYFDRPSRAIYRKTWIVSAGSPTSVPAFFEIGTLLRQHVTGEVSGRPDRMGYQSPCRMIARI